MPEWSIGPHSKCGERVTVPRVRIPVFPQKQIVEGYLLFLFYIYGLVLNEENLFITYVLI